MTTYTQKEMLEKLGLTLHNFKYILRRSTTLSVRSHRQDSYTNDELKLISNYLAVKKDFKKSKIALGFSRLVNKSYMKKNDALKNKAKYILGG